jgi:predicted phosphodiesterase
VICVSDIHGELDLFKRLLEKIRYNESDLLILLGDLYTKGTQCHETLRFCMALDENPDVHILRGNCDWVEDYLTPREARWLEGLPDILESGDYVFVHSGLESLDLAAHRPAIHTKYNNFLETAPAFGKWVVAGHWPTVMYRHEIPCYNPIICEAKNIIAIDGGMNKPDVGQLNAFIIEDGRFSHTYADKYPLYRVEKAQEASGGTISITWNDRFVKIVEDGEKLCRVAHLQTGAVITVPKSQVWTDPSGAAAVCDMATDYHLPVSAGDEVSLLEAFPDRIFARKDGVSGWVKI